MMRKVDELTERFPGMDCGSCGAPSCRALAEDIVRGIAKESDCIYILKEYIQHISDEMSFLDVRKNRKENKNDDQGTGGQGDL